MACRWRRCCDPGSGTRVIYVPSVTHTTISFTTSSFGGFSSFVLLDGRDVAIALKGATVYSHYYQGSVGDPEPLYRKLRRD